MADDTKRVHYGPVRFQYNFYINAPDGDESVAALNVIDAGPDDPDALWISGVQVKAAHRHNGLATQLFDALLGEFGDRKMYLRVQPYFDEPLDVAELERFYAKFGFEKLGVAQVMVREPLGGFTLDLSGDNSVNT
jgi:GNAT superfamily N-acetyltransferase